MGSIQPTTSGSERTLAYNVELEHGTRDPETNVTNDAETMTAKAARAHLNEFSHHYTRLAAIEVDAEAYRVARGE